VIKQFAIRISIYILTLAKDNQYMSPQPGKDSDPIRLEVFKHMFAAIADEMGVILRKTSYSPNIKERRDFSCALFNPAGKMVAQAAHIPVHLGSMPLSVVAAIEQFSERSNPADMDQKSSLFPGDVIILNDPFCGGTHLPDITLVTPVFLDQPDMTSSPLLVGFAANRAHHADVGGMVAGSMPIAREIYQEGLIIPPVKLFDRGRLNQDLLDLIVANVRTPDERLGDIWAQVAANQRGVGRLLELIDRYGLDEVFFYMDALLAYTEKLTRQLLSKIPDGTYQFTDYLDDDGITSEPVRISVQIVIQQDTAIVDFSASAPQQQGSVNAVKAITLSAVYYVFRCLLGLDVPNNSGTMVPIEVIAPPGSVVNALKPAPVAGGNVETSQRIVDVLLGALATALPDRVPAASQGTMNNVTIGGTTSDGAPFTYYETIGGGMGARPWADGSAAVHSHMTNTLNTPVEALEYAYPLRVLRYEIRNNSGGQGQYHGGDGICRDIQVLVDTQVSVISDRRQLHPYGLVGGQPGACGENLVIHNGEEIRMGSKGSFYLHPGDIFSIQTPGGGGFGQPEVDG
jgi:N-methylhydantoinase B